MKLPRDELLRGSRDPLRFGAAVDLAEQVLRTWQPGWTDFLDAPMQEEIFNRLGGLSELRWDRHGGHPGAERCRLFCQRTDQMGVDPESLSIPIRGLLVEGNFLFDPLRPEDLRQALLKMGASPGGLGDLWVRGDRGGQGLCTPECAQQLNGIRDLASQSCGSDQVRAAANELGINPASQPRAGRWRFPTAAGSRNRRSSLSGAHKKRPLACGDATLVRRSRYDH